MQESIWRTYLLKKGKKSGLDWKGILDAKFLAWMHNRGLWKWDDLSELSLIGGKD